MRKRWKKIAAGTLAVMLLCTSFLSTGFAYAADEEIGGSTEEIQKDVTESPEETEADGEEAADSGKAVTEQEDIPIEVEDTEAFISQSEEGLQESEEDDIRESALAASTGYYGDSRGKIGNVYEYNDAGEFVNSWNEGWLQVNGETAFCIHANKAFRSGYMERQDALAYGFSKTGITRFALWHHYIMNNVSGVSDAEQYLLFQCMIWRQLSKENGWDVNNIRVDTNVIPMEKQQKIYNEVYAYGEANLTKYEGHGWVYTNGNHQPVAQFWLTEIPKGTVQLKKVSANTSITNGNSCYSLAGAVYGVYSDASCITKVAELITDTEGNSQSVEVQPGNYYVKEITAPKGYMKDERIYPVTVASKQTAVVSVSDIPGNDPAAIEIVKVDANGEKVQGGASLAGAQFTIKYYDGFYTKETLPEDATRTWVLNTKPLTYSDGKIHYFSRLSDEYKVSGDEFYYMDGNTRPTLPLGTISIEETKAPEGYLLAGGYLQVDGSSEKIEGIYVSQITEENGAVKLNGGNQFKVSDQVKRGDLKFTKIEAGTQRPMGNVKFTITSKTTGESHDFVTDSNGVYSTSAGFALHSQNTNRGEAGDGIWFGSGRADDAKGALPYDTYTITEQPCEANRGHKLVSFDVTITQDKTVKDLGKVENKAIGLTTLATVKGTAGEKDAFATADFSMEDQVSYTNLDIGKEYTLRGTLMDKATKEPIIINGNKVIAKKVFTAQEENGSVTVPFIFDATSLKGKDIVVFQTLYQDGELVTAHADINDEGQTIHFRNPELRTKAADKVIGGNKSFARKRVTITDKVSYTDLIIGKEYTLQGTLMDKETGRELQVDGKAVKAEKTFTADKENGTITLSFTFDASALRGKTTVAFERLYYDGKKIAVHADLKDADQTIEFQEPEIKTTAIDQSTGIQEGYALTEVTIKDAVSYTGLITGQEYTLQGILMDKATGEALLVNGEEVTAEKTFTAEAEEGTEDMEFIFDASSLRGKAVVVFESLLYDGEEIAAHADLEDEGQTVTFKEPEIKTTAKDKASGTQEGYAVKKVTIVDAVSYKGLIIGKEYTVKGILMDKANGKALLVNGEEVTAEKTLTVEAEEGTVDMEFIFDASALKDKEIVVFESLFYEGREIAAHADLQDKDQTVRFKTPEAPPKTGDTASPWPYAAAGAAGLLGGIVAWKKRRQDKEMGPVK